MKVSEAAKRLQVSEITVRRMIKNGHLKASRLYKTANWRISEEEVERILKGGKE